MIFELDLWNNQLPSSTFLNLLFWKSKIKMWNHHGIEKNWISSIFKDAFHMICDEKGRSYWFWGDSFVEEIGSKKQEKINFVNKNQNETTPESYLFKPISTFPCLILNFKRERIYLKRKRIFLKFFLSIFFASQRDQIMKIKKNGIEDNSQNQTQKESHEKVVLGDLNSNHCFLGH